LVLVLVEVNPDLWEDFGGPPAIKKNCPRH